MRYILHHIKTIIRTYNGGIPLTYFLRNYFKLNPKLGSRDRKILSDMIYSWYRCSKGFDYKLPMEDKLNGSLFLCETQTNQILHFLPEAWQQAKQLPVAEKIELLAQQDIRFDIKRLAPADMALSESIDRTQWLHSMLQQPRLFIRVRNKELVPDMLREHHVPFEWVNQQCMSIANGSPVDKILVEDSYAVQDASSQQTGSFFEPVKGEHWWDCCAGAGGKSLLLKDKNADIYLTVSDKRESIISNLLERFKQYHHAQPRSFVLDLTDDNAISQAIGSDKFDNIICDAPCTGSGTWARTPEQLYFFKHGATPEIARLQTTIALNVSKRLKPGGKLYYITCSVFRQENEEVVENIKQGADLVLEKMELINGISQKADSMFIAVFRKA